VRRIYSRAAVVAAAMLIATVGLASPATAEPVGQNRCTSFGAVVNGLRAAHCVSVFRNRNGDGDHVFSAQGQAYCHNSVNPSNLHRCGGIRQRIVILNVRSRQTNYVDVACGSGGGGIACPQGRFTNRSPTLSRPNCNDVYRATVSTRTSFVGGGYAEHLNYSVSYTYYC
jgi:hypothetical protein